MVKPKKLVNPNEAKKFKEFLDYLNEKKVFILKPDIFKESRSWANNEPKRGDKIHMNILYKAELVSEEDLEFYIEKFLKDYTD